MVTSPTPHEASASSDRSISDRPSTSSVSFGRSAVSRPMRLPLPAARMTARDAYMINSSELQRHGRPERLDADAADDVGLHGGDDDERRDRAAGPDFSKRRNEADDRLKDDEMRH